MPTYEYRCKKCKHTFEEFQSITAEPVRVCPECGRKSVERLIGTGAGIIFKGSGFYETDYKRSGAGKPCSEGSKPDSGGGGEGAKSENCKGCDKSESCPASKSAEE